MKSRKQLEADGMVRLNRQGRFCTYCLLRMMNPTVARQCPIHEVNE